SLAWFSVGALLGVIVLWNVGRWYRGRLVEVGGTQSRASGAGGLFLPPRRVALALTVLAILVFSKFIYLASLTSYYTFYVIDRFGVSVQASQLLLFVFLFAVAAGTIVGGIAGDRFGRKIVIWFSILGTLPFTLALPYVNLPWTVVLTSVIGFVMASAFSAILVMA